MLESVAKLKYSLLFTLFLVRVGSYSQLDIPTVQVDMRVLDDETGKPLEAAWMLVYREGDLIDTLISDSLGRFPMYTADLNMTYEFKLWKENRVPKIARMDTHFKYPEDLQPVTYLSMQASLFKTCRGVDWTFLEQEPLIIWSFDKDGLQNYDPVYTKAMLKKIEETRINCHPLVKPHSAPVASTSQISATESPSSEWPVNAWRSEESIDVVAPEFVPSGKSRR